MYVGGVNMKSVRMEISGKTFGKYTVIGYSHTEKKRSFWIVEDQFGVTSIKKGNDLVKLKPLNEKYKNRKIKMNLNENGKRYRDPFYSVWSTMKARCNNPKSQGYKNYGARGIKICDKWLEFKGFYEDMYSGYEKGLSIERVDNNGNYEKENCVWADIKTQSKNKRNTAKVIYEGNEYSIIELAEILGVNRQALYMRYYRRR
jgi:hypothetical protein